MDKHSTHKVSKETMDWATKEIAAGVTESPLALNEDGTPMTLRQLLDKAKARQKLRAHHARQGDYPGLDW